jgi:hypothetical protein
VVSSGFLAARDRAWLWDSNMPAPSQLDLLWQKKTGWLNGSSILTGHAGSDRLAARLSYGARGLLKSCCC